MEANPISLISLEGLTPANELSRVSLSANQNKKEEWKENRPIRIRKYIDDIIPGCKITASEGNNARSFSMPKGIDYDDYQALRTSLGLLGYELSTSDGLGCLSDYFWVRWRKLE